MTKSDKVFRDPKDFIEDFDFGTNVAEVFDDMLDRSVPFYAEIQRMIGEMSADFAVPGTNLYDLGCSTGNTFLQIDRVVSPEVTFVGVDSSQAMLDRAREKLERAGVTRPCRLVQGDLNKGVEVENASVVILNLTLQFVRPLYRNRLMRSVADGILPNGCLILVEKVLSPDSTINRLFIKYYHEMKRRNGYSELEIAQKREALENVLIPYHYVENRELLLESGFRQVDNFFRWYNFCGILAIK
ncbi:carboxy-S-adenosyl-L-methionine synthase CmoA [Dissulfurirhabdus thermomarina]|uniref:Carboxy-S-adenosyl-L-methionine synthase n=1 Tax=Dissulfurirhabdus thermomarina TaxID=1765737 RepID=A0A6N9TPQ3_DISTH|nr:carboxy-S-adenosyl-L-methionine synthase CmoA [Dissulfurirhabdus thermomarina]NDY42420.1 carboxy-S-adenosyl-L-methionine synthase CmoA [Dissulfurirhabdus thermomarina]NMX23546.1 carboxy-S-adenosyl-L-methionine synthase CmoA [Dissulfurirhabdus thermomarina]